jgi:hypothetical protein
MAHLQDRALRLLLAQAVVLQVLHLQQEVMQLMIVKRVLPARTQLEVHLV